MWGVFCEKGPNSRSFYSGLDIDENEHLFTIVKQGKWHLWPRIKPLVIGYVSSSEEDDFLRRDTCVLLPDAFMEKHPVSLVPQINATPIHEELIQVDDLSSATLAGLAGWGMSLDELVYTCMHATGLPVAVGFRPKHILRVREESGINYIYGFHVPVYAVDLSCPPPSLSRLASRAYLTNKALESYWQ
jgi:hypothetical protein